MKDKIIVKKEKNYLAGNYKELDWLAWVATFTLALFVVIGVVAFFSPPIVGYAGDEYLKVNDAGWDSMSYYVVGEVYIRESIASGGFHNSGDQMTVGVSKFVYDQLEEGNVISLSIDSEGGYQYGGDIYNSVDSFPTIDDFLDSAWITCVFATIYIVIIWLLVVLGRKGAEVITLSNVEIIKKIRTWRGMYSYLKCDEGLFRLKDEYVYITCDVGDILYVDVYGDGDDLSQPRFYGLKVNLKKINDASFILSDMMDDMGAEATQ